MPAIPSLGGLRGRGNGRANSTAPERPVSIPLSAHVVDCAVYVNGARLPGRRTHAEAIKEVRRRHNGFVWDRIA
jgi:magnesium transporter